MASTVTQPLAEAVEAIAAGLAVVPAVKTYTWDPMELDSVPAAVVGLPMIERTDLQGSEEQLGSNTWRITFPVNFYFDFPSAQAPGAVCQAQAAEYVEAWIKAFDAATFASTVAYAVEDHRVVNTGPPNIIEDAARPLIEYPTVVELLAFVP